MTTTLLTTGAARASVSQAYFRNSWRVFKTQPGVFVGGAVAVFLLWAILEILVVSFYDFGVFVNVAFHVVFLLLISGMLVALNGLALGALAGQKTEIADLFEWLRRGPSFLTATLLYVVAVAVGLALLVVPGVYVAVRYALFPQVLAARQMGPITALRMAGELSTGRWWHVAGVTLKALLLTLMGAAILGVGAFVAFPVAIIACAGLYRSLLGNGGVQPEPAARPNT